MKTQTIYSRGTQINKIAFSEIEDYIVDLGLNANEVSDALCGDGDFAYVSSGFLRGLKGAEQGEWHHYFVKADGEFEARKLNFN